MDEQFAAYRTAKATRPAWQTALIVAALLFIAGILMTAMSGISVGMWFFAAALIAGTVAGVAAIAKR